MLLDDCYRKYIISPTVHNCYILMQSENKNQGEGELSHVMALSDFAKETCQFLELFQVNGLRKINIYRYPLDNYNKVWKSLCDRIQKAVCYQKSNIEQDVLLSTIVQWVMPEWAAAYNDIFIFIRKFTSGSEAEQPKLSDLKEIYEDLKLEQRFHYKQLQMCQFLRVPLIFLQKFIELALQYSIELETRAKHRPKPERSLIESRELKLALNHFNSQIQLLSKEDTKEEIVNRDNSVIRYNIIRKQYPEISRRRFIMRFVFRLKLICKWQKLQKKQAKRLIERKMKIQQLIDGEDNYIKGLDQYILFIKKPILELGKLDKDQQRKLFSSLGEIRSFHDEMLRQLRVLFDVYNDKQSYGVVLMKYIPFFKLYTDYILNAEVAQRFLKELISSDSEIGEVCRKYNQAKGKVAYNELLQPTFRIARYQMLFESIVKSTSQSHPDYKKLGEVRVKFKQILTQVNDEVDIIIRNMRLNELEQQYGTPEHPIYFQKRQFLNEYSLTLIKEPKPEQVILYIFNDLILIVEEQTRKIIKRVIVDESFFPRREDDNKIYRNMVTIHSDGFMTFTAGPEDLKLNKIVEVYQTLKKITKDSGQQAIVTVLGTEEIGSTSFAKYTEYIVQVKYLDLKKMLHLRFSSMSELVTTMQQHYNDSLKITEDESLRKNWFNSHKSKTIEARKLIIAQILQKLFNHQLIKKQPAFFLNYLNMPHNFYDIARNSYEKRLSLAQDTNISGIKRPFLTKKQEREAFTILCGTEIKLGRDLFHDFQNDEELKKLKDTAERVDVQVWTLIEDQPKVLSITDYDTVEDVCNRVSKMIGLRSNRDFRLFHQIGKKELRVLDHEQLMTKIFKQFPRKQENMPIVGMFEKLRKSIVSALSPDTFPTLIFKKYYYLPFDIEQAQVRKDLTRLRLIVFQVFSEIRDMKYQLSFDEYLLFLAMLVYITLEGRIEDIKDIPDDIVHKVVPETVFKLKNYSESEWLDRCQNHLKRVHEQIQKVIVHNREQLKLNRIKTDTASKTALYFGHRHLCSQLVFNKIKTNPIFGSNLFYVQPHGSCYRKLQEQKLKVAYNMWLAVKVQSLNLLTPSSKESILQIKYKDILKIQVYSESIVLKKNGVIEQQFRLNTYQSFEISQLVKYNQALNEILLNLKEDPLLNSKVKQYRDQIEQYRISYDENGQNISLIR